MTIKTRFVEVRYRLTEEAVRQHYIETGERIDQQRSILLDSSRFTPGDRTTLYDAFSEWGGIDVSRLPGKTEELHWKAQPSISEVVNFARLVGILQRAISITAQNQQRRQDSLRKAYDHWRANYEGFIAKALCSAEIDDLRVLEQVTQLEDALGIEVQHKLSTRINEAYLAKKDEEMVQEKKTWIQENGGQHLRLAFGEGYACEMLYAEERAAKEYPGYSLSFPKGIWVKCSDPTPEALQEAMAVKGEVVVRLSQKESDSLEEAVVIHDFLRKYALIRPMPHVEKVEKVAEVEKVKPAMKLFHTLSVGTIFRVGDQKYTKTEDVTSSRRHNVLSNAINNQTGRYARLGSVAEVEVILEAKP
jgi:regulator of replication initiation timing